MQNQDKLTTVITAFEHWRSNRSGRQVSTPIALREQAVALLNHYSSSKITSALRISGSQLKQWRHTFENAPLFVLLPISPPPLLTQQPFTVELRFAPGRDYALVDFRPKNLSALNLASQHARCILPATLSFSGCALSRFNSFRLIVDKFIAPSSA